jgi:hypothetical protein
MERLLVYALPFVVPLALAPLSRAAGGLVEPDGRAWPATGVAWAGGAVATVVLIAWPLLAVDRYRRAPFAPLRDGPLVLALHRGTLWTARALDRGEPVEWRLDEGGYVPGEDDPRRLSGMRWYLREGWGDLPHYGHGPAAFRAPIATLLLPTFGGRDIVAELELDGAAGVSLNGRPAGRCAAGGTCRVALPGAHLFRGDNVLALSSRPGTALRAVRLLPARP